MRDRGKRDGGRFGTGGCPSASTAHPLGGMETLLRQTGLPDAGRTVDDEGVTPRCPQGARERGQLGSPPNQRPALGDSRCRGHVSSLT